MDPNYYIQNKSAPRHPVRASSRALLMACAILSVRSVCSPFKKDEKQNETRIKWTIGARA